MLVLSRHVNEGITVTDADGNVVLEVMVVELSQGRVKIGFNAERSITVDRNEVWKAKMLSKDSIELTEPNAGDNI